MQDYRSSRVLVILPTLASVPVPKQPAELLTCTAAPPGKACHRGPGETEGKEEPNQVGSRQSDVCKQAKKQGRHSRLPRRGLLLWGRGAAAGDALRKGLGFGRSLLYC